MKTIIFPNWFFPNNLGDSIQFLFVPYLFKQKFPEEEVCLITTGDLYVTLKQLGWNVKEPELDLFRAPPQNFIDISQRQTKRDTVQIIYPEWHPKTWSYWNEHYEFMSNHKTANIITLNYLLQLGLEDLLYDDSIDFTPYLPIDNVERKKFQIGIVPDTKVANRGSPHPGCNGVGYRLNGPNGLDTWREVCRLLKEHDVSIVEFSRENLGLGNEHFPPQSFINTARKVKECSFGIMSDGGMHHVFISQKTPTLLLKGQIISHPDFTRVDTDKYIPFLDRKCLARCNFKNMSGWQDANKNCNLDCETLSATEIAKAAISYLLL